MKDGERIAAQTIPWFLGNVK